MPYTAPLPILVPEIDLIHDPLARAFGTIMGGASATYWHRLKEASGTTFQDETPNNFDGSLVGTLAAYQQPGPLVESNTYSVQVGAGAGRILATPGVSAGPFMWAVWLKRNSGATGAIMNSYNSGLGPVVPQWGINTAAGQMTLWDPSGSSAFGGYGGWSTPDGALPNDGLWHYVALLWNASGAYGANSGAWFIYVDGVQVGTSGEGITTNVGQMDSWYMGGIGTSPSVQSTVQGYFAEPALFRYFQPSFLGTLYGSASADVVGAPTYVNFQHACKGFTVTRGRQRELGTFEAGQMTMKLTDIDSDGRAARNFEPEYPGVLANLVKNPSFEVDLTGWTSQGSSGGATLTRDTTEKYVGAASLKAVSAGGASDQGAQTNTGPSAITAGNYYILQCRVKGASGTVKIQVNFTDDADVFKGSIGGPGTATGMDGTWKTLGASGNAPAGSTKAYVYVMTSGAQTITFYVDAVHLEGSFGTSPPAVAGTYVDGDQSDGRWQNIAHNSFSYRGGKYYPNVKTSRQGRIRASSVSALVQQLAAMTASGNEITDAVRAAGTQGDGRPKEFSVGVWEASTNLDIRGGAEDNGANWTGVSATMTQPTEQPKFGTRSYKAVTTAANGYAHRDVTGLTASTIYTRSVWIYRTETAATITVAARNAADSADLASVTVPQVGGWNRVQVTFTTAVGQTTVKTRITCSTTTTTFYIDGAQMEQKRIATPYIETNGSSQTRNVGRVQAPAAWIDETQGWVAFKVRAQWANANEPKGGAGVNGIMYWHDSSSAGLALHYVESTNQFGMSRLSGGSGASAVSTKTVALGEEIVVVACWTATQVKISVNGAAFTAQANTNIPTLSATLFDIGSGGSVFSAREWDGEILWAAFGTGVLTDADAATFGAITGEIAPGDIPAAALITAIVPADNAVDAQTVQTSHDLALAYLERIPPDYISFRRTELDLPFSDLMARMAKWTVTGSHPSELTSARVNRLLDSVGWSASARVIETGLETVAAATPANAGVLEQLQLMANSEDGAFFIDASGRAVFQNRDHRLAGGTYRARQPLYVFGDGGPTELPYVDPFQEEYDVQKIVNKVIVTWSGGTVEKVDWASVNRDGEISLPITTALSTSAAATALATRVLARLSNPQLRITSLAYEPRRDSRLMAPAVSLGIGDRINVKRRPYAGGTPQSKDCWIERIEHKCEINEERIRWTVTYLLSPAS